MEYDEEQRMGLDILWLTEQNAWKSLEKYLRMMQNDIRRDALDCESLKELGAFQGRDEAIERVIGIRNLVEVIAEGNEKKEEGENE